MVNEKALKTVANYAKQRKCHRNWVYQLIKAEKVKSVEIDGVLFIDVKRTAPSDCKVVIVPGGLAY